MRRVDASWEGGACDGSAGRCRRSHFSCKFACCENSQVQALAWLILAVLVTWDSAALFSLTTTDGALSPSACGVNGALQLWWLLLSGYYLSCGIVQVAGRCAMRRRSPSHA